MTVSSFRVLGALLCVIEIAKGFVPGRNRICQSWSLAMSENDALDVKRFPKGDSAAVEDKDEHVRLLDKSLKQHSGLSIYERIFGEDATSMSVSDIHSNSRFVVISHDTADTTPASVLRNEGPVFNYGNEAAQLQFRMTWDELTKLPSKYSAETMEQEARNELLRRVTEDGFVVANDNIPRVAKGGHRFYIQQYTVWNVYNDHGIYCGQGCIFDREQCTAADL